MIPRAWLPDPARFVPLFRYAGVAPRGGSAPAVPRRWPDKRSADVLDYGLDCRSFLAGVAGSIEDFDLTLLPSGGSLAVELMTGFGGLLIAWLSGGAPGVAYIARWTIDLRGGQRIIADVTIMVSDGPALAAPAMPGLDARSGEALLARDGTPLLPANGALLAAATARSGAALGVRGGGILQFRGL